MKNRVSIREIKRYAKLATMCGLLSVSYTNCSQSGAIALKSASTNGISSAPAGSNTNSGSSPSSVIVAKSQSVYVNGATNKVDVLIVDDNSGSMTYAQKNMGDRFSSFLTHLSALDWQVGITTTDVTSDAPLKDGRLIEFSGLPGQFVLASNSNQTESVMNNAFLATIQRPLVLNSKGQYVAEGSGTERAISAAMRSMQRSLDSSSSINLSNKQLFRSDAALAVVAVSNDDEFKWDSKQSGNNSGVTSPADFMAYVKSAFPNKKIIWHSIIVKDQDQDCLQNPAFGNENFGVWYQQLSGLTGGLVGSICESDYASQLTQMGQATSDALSSIILECAPVDPTKSGATPPIRVRNAATNAEITSFVRKDRLLDFGMSLPIGQFIVDYYCAQ